VKYDATAVPRCVDTGEKRLAIIGVPETVLALDNADGVCNAEVPIVGWNTWIDCYLMLM
jgi:hypothetical protein